MPSAGPPTHIKQAVAGKPEFLPESVTLPCLGPQTHFRHHGSESWRSEMITVVPSTRGNSDHYPSYKGGEMATVKVLESPEIEGRVIGDYEVCIVQSLISGEVVIAQKGQPYEVSAQAFYLGAWNDWVVWSISKAFSSRLAAVEHILRHADPTEVPIPYDEIDQQDDESQEQLALFPAPKRTKEDLLTLLRFRYGKKEATKSSQFLVKIRRARLAKAPRS